MSTISTNLKSLPGAATSHVIHQSMAFSGDRASKGSSFFAGNGPHPDSTFTNAGEPDVGAMHGGVGHVGSLTNQVRARAPSSPSYHPAKRVSKTSFATDPMPRPSNATGTLAYTRWSRAIRNMMYDEGEEILPLPNMVSVLLTLSPWRRRHSHQGERLRSSARRRPSLKHVCRV